MATVRAPGPYAASAGPWLPEPDNSRSRPCWDFPCFRGTTANAAPPPPACRGPPSRRPPTPVLRDPRSAGLLTLFGCPTTPRPRPWADRPSAVGSACRTAPWSPWAPHFHRLFSHSACLACGAGCPAPTLVSVNDRSSVSRTWAAPGRSRLQRTSGMRPPHPCLGSPAGRPPPLHRPWRLNRRLPRRAPPATPRIVPDPATNPQGPPRGRLSGPAHRFSAHRSRSWTTALDAAAPEIVHRFQPLAGRMPLVPFLVGGARPRHTIAAVPEHSPAPPCRGSPNPKNRHLNPGRALGPASPTGLLVTGSASSGFFYGDRAALEGSCNRDGSAQPPKPRFGFPMAPSCCDPVGTSGARAARKRSWARPRFLRPSASWTSGARRLPPCTLVSLLADPRLLGPSAA